MIDRVLLYPYYLYLRLRDRYYSSPKRRLAVTQVPSVCVGNITVGGTGKTPHVEMILRLLQESDRWGNAGLAVLSRGYRRESKGFQQVSSDGAASMFGDEPLQIKKKFPDRVEGCALLCDPSKLASKKYAGKCWNRDFPPADYIILDDAYQYRRLKPTLSIVLVDYNRPVMKDMLLPLGRLRDLPERLYDADVIIVSKCPDYIDLQEQKDFAASMGVMNYDPGNCSGISRRGRRQDVFFTCVEYLVASVLLMITIIGIPFGIQTLKLSILALWPFGSQVTDEGNSGGCLSVLMNVIWIFVGGFWICLTHLGFGLLLCITIIGIPFGRQHFKMAALALAPFGKSVHN